MLFDIQTFLFLTHISKIWKKLPTRFWYVEHMSNLDQLFGLTYLNLLYFKYKCLYTSLTHPFTNFEYTEPPPFLIVLLKVIRGTTVLLAYLDKINIEVKKTIPSSSGQICFVRALFIWNMSIAFTLNNFLSLSSHSIFFLFLGSCRSFSLMYAHSLFTTWSMNSYEIICFSSRSMKATNNIPRFLQE